MTDFFTNLGKRVVSELARPSGKYAIDPGKRARLSGILSNHLNAHLSRPMAKDSALSRIMARDQDPEMPPRGGQSPGTEETPSPDDLLQFVQLILAKLSGPDREEFLMQLTNLLGTEDGGDGTLMIRHNGNGNGDQVPNVGSMPMDRGRRSGARDGAYNSTTGRAGRDRRPAQDSIIRAMNSRNFAQRFPDAAAIRFSGTGR